jgi:hypothetical protein
MLMWSWKMDIFPGLSLSYFTHWKLAGIAHQRDPFWNRMIQIQNFEPPFWSTLTSLPIFPFPERRFQRPMVPDPKAFIWNGIKGPFLYKNCWLMKRIFHSVRDVWNNLLCICPDSKGNQIWDWDFLEMRRCIEITKITFLNFVFIFNIFALFFSIARSHQEQRHFSKLWFPFGLVLFGSHLLVKLTRLFGEKDFLKSVSRWDGVSYESEHQESQVSVVHFFIYRNGSPWLQMQLWWRDRIKLDTGAKIEGKAIASFSSSQCICWRGWIKNQLKSATPIQNSSR